MEIYIDQVSKYFENVPLWPFLLLGVVSVVALAIDLVNRRRKADAIENFRYTIETELATMYPTHIRWPENINYYLCSRLPEMQHNFEVLRLFIPQDQLLEYNTAWNNFCDFCRNITDEQCAASEQSEPEHNEPDPKTVFHKLVADLLSFAKA